MPDEVRLINLAAGMAVTAAGAARGSLRMLTRLPGLSGPAEALSVRGERAVAAAAVVVDALIRVTITKVVAAALDEIDLTRLIRENVDIDSIVEGVDLDRAVARVDLDRVVARVDLDKAVARVDIAAVIGRVDLDAIIETVDLDRAVARVNLDSAIAKVDLIALANFVIDGVDLPDIIRESTGSLSAEAVRGVRSQGMQADDAVTHFVGRLFGRDPGPATP